MEILLKMYTECQDLLNTIGLVEDLCHTLKYSFLPLFNRENWKCNSSLVCEDKDSVLVIGLLLLVDSLISTQKKHYILASLQIPDKQCKLQYSGFSERVQEGLVVNLYYIVQDFKGGYKNAYPQNTSDATKRKIRYYFDHTVKSEDRKHRCWCCWTVRNLYTVFENDIQQLVAT